MHKNRFTVDYVIALVTFPILHLKRLHDFHGDVVLKENNKSVNVYDILCILVLIDLKTYRERVQEDSKEQNHQ